MGETYHMMNCDQVNGVGVVKGRGKGREGRRRGGVKKGSVSVFIEGEGREYS